jgi:hypothetical protein
MSREDDLRALREARFMAKAKRALGPAQPEHVTKPATPATKPATKVSATKPNATKPKGGRPKIGDQAMTSTERSRRRRAKPGGENGK